MPLKTLTYSARACTSRGGGMQRASSDQVPSGLAPMKERSWKINDMIPDRHLGIIA